MSIAKHWAYTFNNYTPDDVLRLSLLPPDASYHVFGYEVSQTGTPHLQGHISFLKKRRFAPVSSVIGASAHLGVCKSLPASILYCKKGGNYLEFGTAPGGVGSRSDLAGFKESVKRGSLALADVREQHSEVYARYPRFCLEYIRDKRPKLEVETFPLRPWQSSLEHDLLQRPNSRTITFCIDVKGNAGKSWFVDHYCYHNDDALIILPGKKADMTYALATCGYDPRVIFIDAPRSKQGDFLQYDFLEELKNGRVFCSKYESHMMRFPSPHVVVMMNEEPDMEKLSEDRYNVINL